MPPVAHELARIAIGNGDHGTQHAELTLKIMDRLMRQQEQPKWERQLALYSTKIQQRACSTE